MIPADPKQCQCEITTYRPFVMGGRVTEIERCDRVPTVILTEATPNPKDGQAGSMSLCSRCFIEFLKVHDIEGFNMEEVL